MPPPERFRSGHVPVPRATPVEDDSASNSDDDEEVHGRRYSLELTPRVNELGQRASNGVSVASYGVNKFRTQASGPRYYSSDAYLGLSYLMEGVQQQKNMQMHVSRYREGKEDNASDSGHGLECVVARVGRTTCGVRVPLQESHWHNVYLSRDMDAPMKKVQDCQQNAQILLPFHCSNEEIHNTIDMPATPRARVLPCTRSLDGSSVKNVSGLQANTGSDVSNHNVRSSPLGLEASASSASLPLRVPTFNASGNGPWHSVIAYDACVRLCLHSWVKGCMEAPIFLENECALLRNVFGLQHILLQSEEELMSKQSSKLVSEGAAPKPKKTIGKMKVQVRKVRMALDMPSGCNFSSLKGAMIELESLWSRLSHLQSNLSSGWQSLQTIHVVPRVPADSPFSQQSLAYVHASRQYIKMVSGLLKIGVASLRERSSYESVQETYSCLLRLKSSPEEEGVRMQPGCGETHLFFPDSLGDDLIIEVHDSKGKDLGRVIAQVESIAEDPSNKVRWWSIHREPEHELVGRIQLYVNYTTSADDNSSLKCCSVTETVAYDLVLEVAMKVQHFQQRKLLLHGSWKWLVTEFASYYGVSDAYTKLRYLSYVLDVATPTADCLILVHDLLLPVIQKSHGKNTLSHQEIRILGEIEEQTEKILAMVFENYKSLDESLPSGIVETFRPASGFPAPALAPAVKLYSLLHDVVSPDAQLKLCSYFQTAAKKRSMRYMAETDEYVASKYDGTLMDAVTVSTAYQKMKTLCLNMRNEIFVDIEIHDQHILPSFIDLPNLSASIYSVELCNRLHKFLGACPRRGPIQHVVDLVIATANFQRELTSWNIFPVKGGVDAKELFHLCINLWIQDKRLSLLESCILDKVKWSGVRTQHLTSPFVDEMYDRLRETLNEYEVIVCRWPEYIIALENAIADIEKAVVESLEQQYADVLAPLKVSMTPMKFGIKYIQKLVKCNSISPYTVNDRLGIFLNTMKRLLDVLWPKIEVHLKSWGSCIPDGGSSVAGEHLSEVTVMLRTKFRNYIQAIVERLAENIRAQSGTKLKKIIQDSKDVVVESDIRSRMQPLKDQLIQTINQLHAIFELHVFIALCRGYWDRMGQEVLNFLKNHKEKRLWYKGSRATLAILDDTFASQMQQLLGNALQEKDLEPPRSIMEVRSILCKGASNLKDTNFYY